VLIVDRAKEIIVSGGGTFRRSKWTGVVAHPAV
jgi:hypothetical protein